MTATSSVRVLAVDDHPRFLDTLRELVEATPGFEWAGGLTSGPEALEAAERCAPDLVLIDVNMPGMDGIEVARNLRRADPDLPIALISADHPDEIPSATAQSEAGPVLPKELLRPAWLREFWLQHRH